MKRLIQKQNAKQVGILYHYTTFDRLSRILKSDWLRASLVYETVSFTRNKNFFNNSEFRDISSNGQCRIAVDGDRLSENYKIRPYNYFAKVNDPDPNFLEQEEIVKGDIQPIIPYIIDITLVESAVDNKDINTMNKLGCKNINEFKEYLQNNFNVIVNIE